MVVGEIPKESIIENINNAELREDANLYFAEVNSISIKASVERYGHYLQVIEINLDSAEYIWEIAYVIQKAIRYQVLFVFVFQERYLVLFRDFKVTESTENVTTDHTHYCTCWIYHECLNEEYLFDYAANEIELFEKYDDSYCSPEYLRGCYEYEYFTDVLDNLISLNNSILESEMVCVRFLLDWLETHSYGNYVNLHDLLKDVRQYKNFQLIGNHMFIEKSSIENAIIEITKSKYPVAIGHTGRRPEQYFRNIVNISSFEEAEDLSLFLFHGYIDMFDPEYDYHEVDDDKDADYWQKHYWRILKEANNAKVERSKFTGSNISQILSDIKKEKSTKINWDKGFGDLFDFNECQSNDVVDNEEKETTGFDDGMAEEETITFDESVAEEETADFDDVDEDIYIIFEDDIHMKLFGVEYDFENEVIGLRFWAWNRTEVPLHFWGYEITINGVEYKEYGYMGLLKGNESWFLTLEITDVENIEYFDIEEVEFSILVDNEECEECSQTQRIKFLTNTIVETFSASVLP